MDLDDDDNTWTAAGNATKSIAPTTSEPIVQSIYETTASSISEPTAPTNSEPTAEAGTSPPNLDKTELKQPEDALSEPNEEEMKKFTQSYKDLAQPNPWQIQMPSWYHSNTSPYVKSLPQSRSSSVSPLRAIQSDNDPLLCVSRRSVKDDSDVAELDMIVSLPEDESTDKITPPSSKRKQRSLKPKQSNQKTISEKKEPAKDNTKKSETKNNPTEDVAVKQSTKSKKEKKSKDQSKTKTKSKKKSETAFPLIKHDEHGTSIRAIAFRPDGTMVATEKWLPISLQLGSK
jgi:hypothetical protein